MPPEEMTDEQVIALRDDREMLKRPHLWPVKAPATVWLKSHSRLLRGGAAFTGRCILWGDEGNADRYIVIRFDWARGGLTETVAYADADAILADDWVVD